MAWDDIDGGVRNVTIGELERLAGIEDREAFWLRFANIRGENVRGGVRTSKALDAGVAELKRIIATRS